MTQENKQLLLVDLCGRLPYDVKVKYDNGIYNIDYISALYEEIKLDTPDNYTIGISEIKPYLRPMSSITEEEKGELLNHVLGGEGAEYFHIAYDGSIDGNQEAEQDLYNLNLHWINFGPLTTASYIDWLNKKMFDFRGLIPKSLALSTEEFNPYKD